jgi:hypothetical protein
MDSKKFTGKNWLIDTINAMASPPPQIVKHIHIHRYERQPGEHSDTNRQLEVAHQKVVQLRRRLKVNGKPGKDELSEIAEKTRKKNGKLNYSKIGVAFGCSSPTAKDWCKQYGIR